MVARPNTLFNKVVISIINNVLIVARALVLLWYS